MGREDKRDRIAFDEESGLELVRVSARKRGCASQIFLSMQYDDGTVRALALTAEGDRDIVLIDAVTTLSRLLKSIDLTGIR